MLTTDVCSSTWVSAIDPFVFGPSYLESVSTRKNLESVLTGEKTTTFFLVVIFLRVASSQLY